MECNELQPLQGPYLDSELDARTSLEIEQHLKSCPNCARVFAEEQKLEARLKAGLNHGQRTAALWDQIERSVSAASRQSPGRARPAGTESVFAALMAQLQAGWQRSPWAWTGLGAAWVVILALNLTARESEPHLVPGKPLPAAAEVRFAVQQKQLLLADLADLAEPAPAHKVKAPLPRPRSDRQHGARNT